MSDFTVKCIPQQMTCFACGWLGDEQEQCPQCGGELDYVALVNPTITRTQKPHRVR